MERELIVTTKAEIIKENQRDAITMLEEAQKKLEKLKKQHSECQSFDSPICGFCGAKRDIIMEAPNGVTLYKLCECEQEQKLVSDIRELSDYVIQLEIKAKTLKRDLERATKKAEKYEAFKIPNRYEYANIKKCYEFLSCGVAQVIRDYLNEFKIGESGNLILVGATGTGKTYLAASMAKYIKSEWLIKVGMINAVNLIKLLKNFENKNEIKEV